MKAFQLLCYLLILTLAFSCNGDDEIAPDPVDPPPTIYYNLNKDSYWIYQWYNIDTSGVETVRNTIDTLRNVGDTLINGNLYIVQEGTYFGGPLGEKFIRESNGDLVDEKGRIFFSSTNFTDVLSRDTIGPDPNDPFIIVNYQMASSETEEITTMAGTFSCLNYQGTHQTFNPIFSWDIRLSDNFYGVGIGEVQSNTFFASSLTTLERRLVEFELK